jgi:transcriptional regulator with XRE-family HTH domain
MREPTHRIQFGTRVREIRRQRGWSQEDLAAQCGLDRTYIGGVERGERNISIDNICRIAAALEVSPAVLLEGVNGPTC